MQRLIDRHMGMGTTWTDFSITSRCALSKQMNNDLGRAETSIGHGKHLMCKHLRRPALLGADYAYSQCQSEGLLNFCASGTSLDVLGFVIVCVIGLAVVAVNQPNNLGSNLPRLFQPRFRISNLLGPETNTKSLIGRVIPQADQLATWWQGDYVELLPSSGRNGCIFQVKFCFFSLRSLNKHYSEGGIRIGTHFREEVGKQAHNHGILWLYDITHHPEAAAWQCWKQFFFRGMAQVLAQR